MLLYNPPSVILVNIRNVITNFIFLPCTYSDSLLTVYLSVKILLLNLLYLCKNNLYGLCMISM